MAENDELNELIRKMPLPVLTVFVLAGWGLKLLGYALVATAAIGLARALGWL